MIQPAIQTPDNAPERAAVQRIARHRSILSRPDALAATPNHPPQVIYYRSATHSSFVRQLVTNQPGALDYFCGMGYQALYEEEVFKADSEQGERMYPTTNTTTTTSSSPFSVADTLVYACLLSTGTANGYIDWNVDLEQPVARGSQGVAVVRSNAPDRVWPGLLLLPLLDVQAGAASKNKSPQNKRPPRTHLPHVMTRYWLEQSTAASTETTMMNDVEWESLLYRTIQAELATAAAGTTPTLVPPPWVLWTLVCSETERVERTKEQRHIGTWCPEQYDSQQDRTCCWIFDPTRPPPPPRRRKREDE